MLKKVVSISFIALATVILLAHAVVPHHHHDDNELFSSHIIATSDGDDCCAEHHALGSRCDDGHHNDDHKSTSKCIVEMVFVDGSTLKVAKSSVEPTVLNLLTTMLTTPGQWSANDLFQNGTVQRLEHHNDSLYSLYLASSVGLRAPPSC